MPRLTRPPVSDDWLVVGLGNPGPQYSTTRHNLGKMALEKWAANLSASPKKLKRHGDVWEHFSRLGSRIWLATLSSFMNRSGSPTRGIMSFHKVVTQRLVIVHDDLDLPFGAIKLKFGGGGGGHNGVRDVVQALGTAEFFRVRVGIGRPAGQISAADYVLQKFSNEQAAGLQEILQRIIEAAECLVEEGLLDAQQKFHPLKPF